MMVIALQKDQEMAAHWKTQIEQCDKATNKWIKRAEKISKNYRDERDDQDKGAAKRLNLFWSNVQTLKPVYYSKIPSAIVERRFLDKDTVGRVAATILERNLRYEISFSNFDEVIRMCRLDWMVPGRGQVWVRYNPKFGDPISPKSKAVDDILLQGDEPDDEGDKEENVEREVVGESVDPDYVHWKDFYTFPASARHWLEVQGVGRKIYMSRQDLIDNFGEEKGKKIELDYPPKMDGNQGGASLVSGQEGMQATVHEIWWRPERKVYFIAKGYDELCKEADDPLKLEKFFPCPRPLSGTLTNDSMIPVPEYAECQDQYIQIDDLTKRIDILTACCKIVGAYDSANPVLKNIFLETQEPNLVPVDSWVAFAEKGGVKGAVQLVEIGEIAKVLEILISVRRQIIEDLDRLTGIHDVMRGTGDARQTMGGQKLQSNAASMRTEDPKYEMSRFCRDVICIMGEIISEHYSPETLVQVSGALNDEGLDPPALPQNPAIGIPMAQNQAIPSAPPVQGPAPMPPQEAAPAPGPAGPGGPPPAGPQSEPPELKMRRKMELIAKAIELLRQDKLRGFRIDIETDSTVQGDAEQEKAQRIEFITGVTKFLETGAMITTQVPEAAPLLAKMLQFGVRGFRVGRDLESAIEEFCEKAETAAKAAAANPQAKPDPEMIKAQTEQMKAMSEIERQKIENEGEAHNAQMDFQSKQIDLQMKQIEFDIKKLEFHGQRLEASMPKEGEGTDSDGIHPHMALNQIAEAAKVFDIASRRNSAPKRIHRGPDGKATHITTEFQEQ
jgi:hypothetical protein